VERMPPFHQREIKIKATNFKEFTFFSVNFSMISSSSFFEFTDHYSSIFCRKIEGISKTKNALVSLKKERLDLDTVVGVD
jgi:hypothetical protein